MRRILNSHNTMTIVYGFVVTLILAIGCWWMIFVAQEGRRHVAYERHRLESELAQATLALDAHRGGTLPVDALSREFPNVDWSDPSALRITGHALEDVRREAARRTRMFVSEGITLALLLLGGTSILAVAHRAERRYRAAREVFLEETTHDLRTPLASLQLSLDTLDRTDLAPSQRAQVRERMKADTHRLHLMVEQMLSAGGGVDEGEPLELLDLADAARGVVGEFAGLVAETHTTLELELPPGCIVRGRRVMLTAAVRNLVDNAVKYAGENGIVRVRLEAGHDLHRLAVEDTGPGIPPDQHAAVFRRFVRNHTGGEARGSGLGLYLARRNVESMGGRIDLHSDVGRGARFEIVLPAAAT